VIAAETASVTRAELFDGRASLELMRAAYLTHRFSPHAHEELAVGVVESGAARSRHGRGTLLVPAGRIVALNPGDVHTGEAADPRVGYRYRMFYVPDALLRLATGRTTVGAAGDGDALSFAEPVIHDPELAARLVRAHALIETGEDRVIGEGLLADALGDLARRHGTPERGGAPDQSEHRSASVVRVVREYLEDEHARVVTLAELSELTGFSPFHLSRTFRAAVGVPPYAYLALVRVRRARELLARGQPVSDVTYETGFSDQSHFTRHFKRVVGVPPGQYARAAAGDVARRRPPAVTRAPRHTSRFEAAGDRPRHAALALA